LVKTSQSYRQLKGGNFFLRHSVIHGSLGPPGILNPSSILTGSDNFAQLTAKCPYTMGYPFPPQNCPFPWGDLDPHLIHGSLGTS